MHTDPATLCLVPRPRDSQAHSSSAPVSPPYLHTLETETRVDTSSAPPSGACVYDKCKKGPATPSSQRWSPVTSQNCWSIGREIEEKITIKNKSLWVFKVHGATFSDTPPLEAGAWHSVEARDGTQLVRACVALTQPAWPLRSDPANSCSGLPPSRHGDELPQCEKWSLTNCGRNQTLYSWPKNMGSFLIDNPRNKKG